MDVNPHTEPTLTFLSSEDKAKLRDFAIRNGMSMAHALRLSAHLFIKSDSDTAQTILNHARGLFAEETTPVRGRPRRPQLPPQYSPPSDGKQYSPLEPLPRVTHSANKVGDQ